MISYLTTEKIRQDTRDVDMDRMMMIREDQLSLQYEKFMHVLKFSQKDIEPPAIPNYLLAKVNAPL
jgi:hypothetical protein